MSALVWDNLVDRIYEAGLDHGVIYVGELAGFAWNGLTSVEENDNVTTEPLYFDGFKALDLPSIGDFSATLKAITYPDVFMQCQGVIPLPGDFDGGHLGLFVTEQNPSKFGLSYRTLTGNPTDGLDHGYKLHFLYNVTAVPDNTSRDTLAADTSPIEFSWTITTAPVGFSGGLRPTSHIILDSKFASPEAMAAVELILYGTDDVDPRLPLVDELRSIVGGV